MTAPAQLEDATTIVGLAIPFGGKDADGEYFDRDTDFCLDWMQQRPLLYHDGLDRDVKTAVVGTVTETMIDALGV